MKSSRLLLVVLAPSLVLSAFCQTNDVISADPKLQLMVDVHTTPFYDEKTAHVKYHVAFDLSIKNIGNDDYNLPVSKLWNVNVTRQDSQEVVNVTPTGDESNMKFVAPGEKLHTMFESASGNDVDSGVYKVTATFNGTAPLTTEFTLPPPQMNADILFTGRLMGYYRLPNRQMFAGDTGCNAAKEASADAKLFFDTFPYKDGDHQIRLGVGDNFAPNYYSRAFANLSTEAGKDIYYWDTKQKVWGPYPEDLKNLDDVRQGYGTIPTDNVACFLSRAHYDAIVPGMLDFHYGPERLRELARFLATIPEDGNFQPVQILAANMMMKTSWTNGHTPVPDRAKRPLPFITKYLQKSAPRNQPSCSLEITNIADGDFVFPWMQSVGIQATRIEAKGCKPRFDAPEVYLCEAAKDDPDDFLKTCRQPSRRLSLKDDTTGGNPRTRKLTYDLIPLNQKTPDVNPGNVKPTSDTPATALTPGTNYAICVFGPEGIPRPDPSKPYCVRFSVYTPFFQYPDWPKEGRSDGQTTYKNPALYVVKNDSQTGSKPGTPVVIFGIVDPDMLENVGADNDSWQAVSVSKSGGKDFWQKQYKTQIVITDPVQTLTQLQEFFEKDYSHGKPFRGLRILLAQMPPQKAKQLAEDLPEKLRFDLIISAADNGLATPNQTVRIEPALLSADDAKSDFKNGTLATPATFIAVPPRHDQSKKRWLQARNLAITSDGHTYWQYTLTGRPILVQATADKSLSCLSASDKSLGCVADQFWKLIYEQGCKPPAGKNCNGAWQRPQGDERENGDRAAIQQLALWFIRQKVHADVALLQQQDFYGHGLEDYIAENCRPKVDNPKHSFECTQQDYPRADLQPEVRAELQSETRADLQQILERIIWEGNFIKTLSVTGAVLKAILKKSKQFAKSEEPGNIPTGELGRALVTLGISPDPNDSDEYLVNGRPLDPNVLYTVATSDYIALGDTGYSELAKPPVGDPDPPAMPRGDVQRISAILCDSIQLSSNDSSYFVKTCDEKMSARDLFDRAANRKPDDPRSGNTNLRKFYAWTFLRPRLGQRVGLSKDVAVATPDEAIKAAMQDRVEHGTNWLWSFDKLSVGFSGLSHTGSEESVSQKFGGVLSPTVTTPHSHSWDWDANSKFTVYHPRVDWFLSDILQYSSTFISQAGQPRTETQSRNQFAFDGGTYLHLPPSTGKTLPQLSLVLSGHFETTVGSPITTLQIASSTLPLVFDQGRTFLLLGRSGFRWENRKSYVEAGLEGGQTLNDIEQFNVLTAPGGPTVPCRLEASVSLTTCINNFNQTNPATPVTSSSTIGIKRSPLDRYGAYWTMRVAVPINDTISYNFQDLSDYFFLSGGDNSGNTRFRHQLIHSLKFKVFPNLSFEPTYTMYFYENKVDYNFLLQQQYSIKINYSFSLSNVHESGRQLKYPKPSSE